MESQFRDEIAGLRAVAVIIVTLFHLKVSGIDGGFVGVDVFFVISGYLISRNILRDLDRGRFTLAQFYMRRSRRIFPALIFTVILTYVLGALWCSPLMFLDLAKECTHALLSIANIQYWRESHKYFAAASDELALLHTWSLSAEEQFYLFWPLFLMLAKKTGRPFLMIALAGIVSLGGSIIVDPTDPQATFFLTPFRIFEFAIGAMLLNIRRKPEGLVAGVLSGGGLLAIIASALLFSSGMPYLNVAMLVPCLGAAAVIWAGDRPLSARLITNPPMLYVGAISYSLYLCHWPVIFFGRFIFGEAVANSVPGIIVMITVMLALAAFMYSHVERRFIAPETLAATTFGRTAILLWGTVIGLVAITHGTFLGRGLAWRLPQAQAAEARQQSFPRAEDIVPMTGPVGTLLVGDSITMQYAYGLAPLLQKLNIGFAVYGDAGCPMVEGVTLTKSPRRDICLRTRDADLPKLAANKLPIIYTQRWVFYDDLQMDYAFDKDIPPVAGSYRKLRKALERTLETQVGQGHRILLIGPQVEIGCTINLPRLMPGPLPRVPQPPCPAIPKTTAEQMIGPLQTMLTEVAAKWPGKVSVLRTLDYFCDSECPVVLDGVWQFNNSSHYSIAGSDRMVSRSTDAFRKFLTDAKP